MIKTRGNKSTEQNYDRLLFKSQQEWPEPPEDFDMLFDLAVRQTKAHEVEPAVQTLAQIKRRVNALLSVLSAMSKNPY